MKIALIGNPNSGKTTLFNHLTGSHQHVGNFPGITISHKEGVITEYPECLLIDLPGIYSLSCYSNEEIITRNYLMNEKIDCIINIIDGTNIKRNLFLTLQLIELQMPMILAINMMDELHANGGNINIYEFEEILGIDCIPISAIKNEGISELIKRTIHITKNKIYPTHFIFSTDSLYHCIQKISSIIQPHVHHLPIRFIACKLIEGDLSLQKQLKLTENEIHLIEKIISDMEIHIGMDREVAIANMRYSFIENLCMNTVIFGNESKEYLRSMKFDSILTNKYFSFPCFFLILFIMFYLTFGPIGTFFVNIFEILIDMISLSIMKRLNQFNINQILFSLITNGIFAGIRSILSFMPVILIFYFFLSILEDSGYMARIAFIMDKPLRKFGLSGKSFVSMIIGFGCSVPAIMSTRFLHSKKERARTISLIPFMSCSAKIPIYTIFTHTLFPNLSIQIILLLYITGILMGMLLMSLTNTKASTSFIIEMPNYRFPSMKSISILMFEKAKEFLIKAFTIIYITSILIWFLQSFDLHFNFIANPSTSILATLSQSLTFIFKPLGFGDWRVITALICGFSAKEVVISTLILLTQTTELTSLFTPLSAYSFLLFTLFYSPCVAAIAATKHEIGIFYTIIMVVMQCLIAWITAFIFYQVGLFFIFKML